MSPFAMTYGEFSYPTPPAQVCRLGLPLKQFSFAPHSYRFILPFSSGMIAFQLTTLPACCTPHQVSPPDKLADDRRLFHLPFWITLSYRRAIGGISIYPCALAYTAALPDARRVSAQRLAAFRRQVSKRSPPNRTYTSQCIRLSRYQSSFPACNLTWQLWHSAIVLRLRAIMWRSHSAFPDRSFSFRIWWISISTSVAPHHSHWPPFSR